MLGRSGVGAIARARVAYMVEPIFLEDMVITVTVALVTSAALFKEHGRWFGSRL